MPIWIFFRRRHTENSEFHRWKYLWLRGLSLIIDTFITAMFLKSSRLTRNIRAEDTQLKTCNGERSPSFHFISLNLCLEMVKFISGNIMTSVYLGIGYLTNDSITLHNHGFNEHFMLLWMNYKRLNLRL